MGHRYVTALCCLVLLLAGCSRDEGAPRSAAPEAGASSSPEPEGSPHEPKDASKTPSKKVKPRPAESSQGEPSEEPQDEPQTSEGQAQEDGSGAPVADGSSGRRSGGTAGWPASGGYIYAQEGYEEFCNGASCDRSDLPARQRISSTVTSRTGGGTEVLTEIKAGDDRIVRTKTLYSKAAATVTSVYARFAYSGFVFENDYTPDPPVEILRFPLREGAAWSGEWTADVSGSYRARVIGRESVQVGGRAVEAFKIATSTTFRGEFRGTSDTQIWIDPKTKATVRTSGLLRLKTNFGDYNTAFQTSLKRGPGG